MLYFDTKSSDTAHTRYLCVEEGQTPDGVEGEQHFDQKLFMLRFQWQSETIDYTGRETQRHTDTEREREDEHKLNMNTWKSFIVEDQWAADKTMFIQPTEPGGELKRRTDGGARL